MALFISRFYRTVFVIGLLLSAVACSSSDKEEEAAIVNRLTAEEYYQKGVDKMAEKRYVAAVEDFLEIEKEYPFSPLASKAQIIAAFAYYKDVDYEKSLDILDRFIRLHPGNDNISYAYYLRALCYYERIADVKRDQKITKLALDALDDVVKRFPQTEYARDAKLKLDLTNDHLAGKEMEIGRFYQRRGQYIASINRFKSVIQDYQTTSHVPEALYRLSEVYLIYGVESEARKYAAVLGHNFPDSKWYQYAYRLVAGGESSPVPEGGSEWYDRVIPFAEQREQQQEEQEEDLNDSWYQKMLNVF